MRPLCSLVMLILVGVTYPASASQPWKQLQSQNFTVIGQTTDQQLHEVAFRLEQFRAALWRLFPRGHLAASAPVVVTVFPDKSSNRPYMPRFHGRTVEVAGLFVPGPDVNHVTLNLDDPAAAFSVVFHEYVHLLVGSIITSPPLWLHEGLAEYYSTFEVTDEGTRVHLGGVPADHVMLLRHQPLLPLRELFAVTHDSPLYNEGSKRSVFYAQSWALMHYLLVGNPVRTPQLGDFLDRISSGRPVEAAFREAFQMAPDGLSEELRRYLQGNVFKGRAWTFDEAMGLSSPGPSRPVSRADLRAHLADLLMRLGHNDEAMERLLGGSQQVTPSANFLKSLGRVYMREGHFDAAVSTLERAVSLAPSDSYAHYYLGLAHMHRLEENGRLFARNRPVAAAARRELLSALELNPGAVDALAQLGLLESLDRHTIGSGRARLERAVALAPTRPEYRIALGELQVRQGDYDSARNSLRPLVALLPRGILRTRATDLMAAAGKDTPAGPDGPAPLVARSPGDAASGEATESTGLASMGRSGGRSRVVPSLRSLRSGEDQVEAQFASLDCSDRAVVARFVTPDGASVGVSTADPGAVQFISYRPDVTGSLRCGRRSGTERVLVTWVSSDSAPARTGRELIAVEFLPDGFTVRAATAASTFPSSW